MLINQADIKCPKCGKRYFRVKPEDSFVDLVFKVHEDPIYKDGVLQNPPHLQPQKTRYQCLECGCNFRSEEEITFGEVRPIPRIIDEDIEKEEIECKHQELVEQQKKNTEKVKVANDLTGCITIANCDDYNTISAIHCYGEGKKSTIDLGGFIIKSDIVYTNEQIKNIKDLFGWDVKNDK